MIMSYSQKLALGFPAQISRLAKSGGWSDGFAASRSGEFIPTFNDANRGWRSCFGLVTVDSGACLLAHHSSTQNFRNSSQAVSRSSLMMILSCTPGVLEYSISLDA